MYGVGALHGIDEHICTIIYGIRCSIMCNGHTSSVVLPHSFFLTSSSLRPHFFSSLLLHPLILPYYSAFLYFSAPVSTSPPPPLTLWLILQLFDSLARWLVGLSTNTLVFHSCQGSLNDVGNSHHSVRMAFVHPNNTAYYGVEATLGYPPELDFRFAYLPLLLLYLIWPRWEVLRHCCCSIVSYSGKTKQTKSSCLESKSLFVPIYHYKITWDIFPTNLHRSPSCDFTRLVPKW